jgi:hypothetical protein
LKGGIYGDKIYIHFVIDFILFFSTLNERWFYMLAIAFDTKKELKQNIGHDIASRIIETSLFGREYHSNFIGCVVVSKQPGKIRKSFAQIQVENDILLRVK